MRIEMKETLKALGMMLTAGVLFLGLVLAGIACHTPKKDQFGQELPYEIKEVDRLIYSNKGGKLRGIVVAKDGTACNNPRLMHEGFVPFNHGDWFECQWEKPGYTINVWSGHPPAEQVEQ